MEETKAIETNRVKEIRTLNGQLEQELMELKCIINDSSLVWQSPSTEIIRTRFNKMIPIFEDYRNSIDHYADYLDRVVCNEER